MFRISFRVVIFCGNGSLSFLGIVVDGMLALLSVREVVDIQHCGAMPGMQQDRFSLSLFSRLVQS